MKNKKVLLGASLVVLALGAVITPVLAHNGHHHQPYKNNNKTIIVTSADLENSSSSSAVVKASGSKKWFMYNDSTDTLDNTLGSFIAGPADPPNGVGSIQFTLGANPLDRKNIATYQFAGTPLKSITKMSFTVYSQSGVAGPTESPYFNFNVDFNGSNTWQRRLVYVPSANGAVPQDTWNTFDVIKNGNALWTWSGYAANGNKWPDNDTNQYRSWNAIKTAWPNARILPSDGWLGIRVGEPGPTNYVGSVDAFIFGTKYHTTTFDFEPTVGPPVTYAECQNDGWKTFNTPVFKSKEKCMEYVKAHNHTVKGKNLQYTAGSLSRFADFEADVAGQNGNFFYKDANHDWYKVKVSKVKIDGTTGWFAGVVTKASNPAWVGLWLFAKTEDATPDKIWGSFTDQTTAQNGVASMTDPGDGPFTITKGYVKVH